MKSRYVKQLDQTRVNEFKEYCHTHKDGLDDSFLSEASLENFTLENNPPTQLLIEDDQIVGVCSIMIDLNARVRIFHVTDASLDSYKALNSALVALLKDRHDIETYNIFLPQTNKALINIMHNLGLEVERHIYVLEKAPSMSSLPLLDPKYTLKPMVFPTDTAHWCHIRNTAFRVLKGFTEYPVSVFADMNKSDEYIENGTLILWDGETPIGIAKVSKEVENNETLGFIGPIALLPEYQGQGLGRKLLQAMVHVANESGSWKSSLCVNADNEDALKLYLSEGFEVQESVTAMTYTL